MGCIRAYLKKTLQMSDLSYNISSLRENDLYVTEQFDCH